MQVLKNKLLKLLIVIIFPAIIYSCGKKEEPQTFIPPDQENTVDKEKERLEREEFERLKRLQNGEIDSSLAMDSIATADSLKTVKEENKKGSIEIGKLADLVILDRDIFSIAPEEIISAEISATIKNGFVVYRNF